MKILLSISSSVSNIAATTANATYNKSTCMYVNVSIIPYYGTNTISPYIVYVHISYYHHDVVSIIKTYDLDDLCR